MVDGNLNLHGQRMGAILFQSLEGFMVDGNVEAAKPVPSQIKLFQSLEGFMVDGNSSV